MAKHYDYDPRVPYADLSPGEQESLRKFRNKLKVRVMGRQQKMKLFLDNPKKRRWIQAQGSVEAKNDLAESARELSPEQRVRIEEEKEAGPLLPKKQTLAEYKAEQEAKKRIVAGVWGGAFPGGKEFDPKAYSVEMGTKKAIVEAAFPGMKEKKFDALAYRKELGEKVAILKEEMPGLFKKEEFDPEAYRKEMRAKAGIVKEEFPGLGEFDPVKYTKELEQKFEISGRLMEAGEVRQFGSKAIQDSIRKIKAEGFPALVRAYVNGQGSEIERVRPGTTVEVWGKERDRIADEYIGDLLKLGKKPWEITLRDTDNLRLTQAGWDIVMARAADRSPDLYSRLVALRGRPGRPLRLEVIFKAFAALRAGPETTRLRLPGPLPLTVHVPALKGWTLGETVRAKVAGGVVPLPTRVIPVRGIETEAQWEARLLKTPAALAATMKPLKLSTKQMLGQAVPEILQTAIATGAIPQQSTLAAAYGAYATAAMVKSVALKAVGPSAAAWAGPLGIAFAAAQFLSFLSSRKKAKALRAQQERAGAAQMIRRQVGAGAPISRERFVAGQRRGRVRPFAPVFASRLGLAQTTPTPAAKI